MLKVLVPVQEMFDDENNRFVYKTFSLEMEHSLISLSKWESKFEKPFLSEDEKTPEETLAYFKMMTLTPDVPDEVFDNLTQDNINQIKDYIQAKMTATWFREEKNQRSPRRKQAVTSELIYYWLVSLQIPFEVENWHLERLMTLIKVCNEQNKQPKKMSKRELMNKNRALNEQRRKQYGTKG